MMFSHILPLWSLSILAYLPGSTTLPTRPDGMPLTTIVSTGEDLVSDDDFCSVPLASGSVAVTSTTSISRRTSTTASCSSVAALNLQLAIVNSLDSSNVNAYITGLDQNNVPVYVTPDGVCQAPEPLSTSVPRWLGPDLAINLPGNNHTTHVNIPGFISSGRVSIAVGDLEFGVVSTNLSSGPVAIDSSTPEYNFVTPSVVNPHDANYNTTWGFMELTYNASDKFFADVSYVDYVGLPVGMKLETDDDKSFYVPGMPSDAISKLCDLLKGDGDPWNRLCIEDSYGNALRVISPDMYLSNSSLSTSFENYWTSYVDRVWQESTDTGTPLIDIA